jgi:acetoin utilization deacetylase AcuC-like enzyme
MLSGFVCDERLLDYNNGEGAHVFSTNNDLIEPYFHIDNSLSKKRLYNLMKKLKLLDDLRIVKVRTADINEISLIHELKYINKIKYLSETNGGEAGYGTPFSKNAFEISSLGIGGLIDLSEKVFLGEIKNGFALIRPPGHHALENSGYGFCIFNNVAIAAECIKKKYNLSRIAILDWDVHHGNGTEKIFYHRNDVLYISIHQHNCYPVNSGSSYDNGLNDGRGYNININVPPGSGHAAYIYAFDEIVVEALESYEPEIIFVCCGFDSSGIDPLSRTLCHADTFRFMTNTVLKLADQLCEGKVVMSQEGGYSEAHVPFCGLAVLEEMIDKERRYLDPVKETIVNQGGETLLESQILMINKSFEALNILKSNHKY